MGRSIVDGGVIGLEVIIGSCSKRPVHGFNKPGISCMKLAITPISRPPNVNWRIRRSIGERCCMAVQHVGPEFLKANPANAGGCSAETAIDDCL